MLSARLGDILSELYLLSGVLKRWQDEGEQHDDLPLVHFCLKQGFTTIETRYAEVLRNLPNRPVAWLVRFFTQPFGAKNHGPCDELIKECAELLLKPSKTRERLTRNLYGGKKGEPVHDLEQTFHLLTDVAQLNDKIKKAKIHDIETAVKKGILTKSEAKKLTMLSEAVKKIITVDDFAAKDFKP